MGDLAARPRLLPDRTSWPHVDALVDVDGRLDDLDTGVIAEVLFPETCPPGLLAYLAFQRSVDVWDPTWPDEIKRAVIIAAPTVHRLKGTRRSVAVSLAALGMRTQVVEWWETIPKGEPYTFLITAFATLRYVRSGPLITKELTQAALDSVDACAPASRSFEFRIGVELYRPTGAAVAGSAYGLTTPTVRAQPSKRTGATAAAAVAGSAYGLTTPYASAQAATGTSSRVCGTFAGRAFALTPARAAARPVTATGARTAAAVAGSACALAAAAVPARAPTGTSAQAGARAAGRAVVFITARMDAR